MMKKNEAANLFENFLESEQFSGVVLIICLFVSIAVANSPLGNHYAAFWHARVGLDLGADFSLKLGLERWINDGLMAVFFLSIGLEIEREIYIGELSRPSKASLPIIAAVGGMAMPATLHMLLNWGTETRGGAGIPMATDIAFALGAIALLGNKIPAGLKVFLAALAIIDDLGAIIVIALFYAGELSFVYLALAVGIFTGLLVLNRLGISRLSFYLIPGVVMWYFMLRSGVHPTITGVLLAFAVPFGRGDEESPSFRLQTFLHKPVSFIIMPLFALANTDIELAGKWIEDLATPNSIGIFAGLFVGKPLGIALFSLLAVKLRLSQLPDGVSWRHIMGAGFLGGIGFTMSIFIALLAFGDPEVVQSSKISVLLSSFLAGTVGFLILKNADISKRFL